MPQIVQDMKFLGEFVTTLYNLAPWVLAYAAEHPLMDWSEVRVATVQNMF